MKNVIMMTIAIIVMAGCEGVGFESAQIEGTCDLVEDDLNEALVEIEALEAIDFTCAPAETDTAEPKAELADVEAMKIEAVTLNSIIVGLRADIVRARNELNEFNADLVACESELDETKYGVDK